MLTQYACPAGAESAPAWLQLTSLRCPRNSIPTMDASLMTLPALRSCDLSGNVISIVQVWPPSHLVPKSSCLPPQHTLVHTFLGPQMDGQ